MNYHLRYCPLKHFSIFTTVRNSREFCTGITTTWSKNNTTISIEQWWLHHVNDRVKNLAFRRSFRTTCFCCKKTRSSDNWFRIIVFWGDFDNPVDKKKLDHSKWWGSTLTCQATTWLTSTSCPLRKSGVVILLLSKQEKVSGFRNMEFWAKAEWTGGAEKSTECNWKKQPFLGVFLKSCNVCFPFSLSRVDYLSRCSLESLPVCLSPEEGQCQPVCPKVLVKCKSSNIQHEHVGEWFEFLRQIPFVNIALIVWSQL